MVLDHKKTAVIGAGPVGLTFARLLQQSGARVKVYERDKNETARIKGGTLDLHHDVGQIAIKEAGLLHEFYARARPAGERSVTMDAEIIEDRYPETGHLYDRPEIDRNDLRALLLESLHPGTVVWDSRLRSLERQGDRFILHFENGTTETADLVVGANGGMSNVQKYVTDTIPQYTGTVIIQGEVLHPPDRCPDFKKLCGDGNMAAIAEQKFFFCQNKAGGALNYYVSFRKPESWIRENGLDFHNAEQISSFLGNLLGNWNKVYKELFAATDEFTLLPMRIFPVGNWKSHKHITLIGDAAHLMPPFSGIGVNIGMLDAYYLADDLTSGKFTDIQSAINAYETRMSGYAATAQQDTEEAENSIHSGMDFSDIAKERR